MLKTLKKLLTTQKIDYSAAGRNDPCPCGSGKKFKACHYQKERARQREESHARQFGNPKG